MSVNPLVQLYRPIYGSLYFATIMSTGFYGVTCMQTFFYFVHYQNDHLRTKILVAAVWAFNTVHEALVISGGYKYIMAGLVNPFSMLDGVPELVLQLVFSVVVAVCTQGFFVYRIYLFNEKSLVAPLVWTPLGIYQMVATLIYVRKALYSSEGLHVIDLLVLNDPFFMGIATSSLTIAAAVDVMIAIFLMFLLLRKRSVTDYASTVHILQRLTVFAVNAGLWTALFAILSLILLHLYPSNLLYAVFGFPLCSIYCNTLLANLNARAYIRGETTSPNVDVDLFTSSASRGSVGTKCDNRPRVVSFRASGGNLSDNNGGVAFFPVIANRPTSGSVHK